MIVGVAQFHHETSHWHRSGPSSLTLMSLEEPLQGQLSFSATSLQTLDQTYHLDRCIELPVGQDLPKATVD